MFEKLKRKFRKVIKIDDTSLEEIQRQCLATHKVGGFYRQHGFDLVLIHINGERRTVIYEACARFNTLDHIGVLGFWTLKAELESYLWKKQQNAEWVAKNGRPSAQPYSPEVLAASAVCAVNFSLENIQSIVKNQEEQMLEKFGVYPTEPTLLVYEPSRSMFTVFLRIEWSP